MARYVADEKILLLPETAGLRGIGKRVIPISQRRAEEKKPPWEGALIRGQRVMRWEVIKYKNYTAQSFSLVPSIFHGLCCFGHVLEILSISSLSGQIFHLHTFQETDLH